MDPFALAIFEGLLFFIIFAITFRSFMSMDISSIFKKGSVREMQFIYIFISIALAYLVLKGIMNLVTISITIFS